MKSRSKIIAMVVVATIITAGVTFNGYAKNKEIPVSNGVKTSLATKVNSNIKKSEPILKDCAKLMGNQRILSWIDNNNILTFEQIKDGKEYKLKLYSYNLDSKKSTELIDRDDLNILYGYDKEAGVVLIGNQRQVFEYDAKEKKLTEILSFDKEFKDGIPGFNCSKEKQALFPFDNVRLIKKGYISYITNLKSKDTAEYTILNYKENKKISTYETEYNAGGLTFKFDSTGNFGYIGEMNKLTKLNLKTGEKSSIELSCPTVLKEFEDGTLMVGSLKEDGGLNGNDEFKRGGASTTAGILYKVDFSEKKITKYDDNYGEKSIAIASIDYQNNFVNYIYHGEGKDEGKKILMYGTLEGDKFVVKDKLFKNNEEAESNIEEDFSFSPDHSKFVTQTSTIKMDYSENCSITALKNDIYLFELK